MEVSGDKKDKKLYIIETFRGINGLQEAEYATSTYARIKGGTVIYDESQIPEDLDSKEIEIERVSGLNLYYSGVVDRMVEEEIQKK